MVITLGTSWTVIPELIGYLNSGDFLFFKNHSHWSKFQEEKEKFGLASVNKCFVVTTNGERVKENLRKLMEWEHLRPNLPDISCYSYESIAELNSLDEIARMSDLIFRTVLHARELADEGKVFLSLTGGRKNMSAICKMQVIFLVVLE